MMCIEQGCIIVQCICRHSTVTAAGYATLMTIAVTCCTVCMVTVSEPVMSLSFFIQRHCLTPQMFVKPRLGDTGWEIAS